MSILLVNVITIQLIMQWTYDDPVKTKLLFVAKHDIECLALIVAVKTKLLSTY